MGKTFSIYAYKPAESVYLKVDNYQSSFRKNPGLALLAVIGAIIS